jgi:hypothetical protein
MNRARPNRKILIVLCCALALLAAIPVLGAVGGEDVEPEAQAAAATRSPVDATVSSEESALHSEPVKGLPFSNFDLLALVVVLAGFISLSFAMHILSRDQAQRPDGPPVTTDAE